MEFHLKIGLACISILFCFHCISSEETLDGPGALKWTCLCAGGPLGALNSPTSDCSTSCDCRPDGAAVPGGGGWNCSCGSGVTPQASNLIHNSSCFTACNCTSGASPQSTAAKKNVSNKAVIALLLCVVLTVVAFLTSIAYHFYRKDRVSGKPAIFSSDKDSSWNSATNLISNQRGSSPDYSTKSDYSFNPITGFIRKISFIFRSERGTSLGAIIQFSYFELEQATNKFSDDNLIGLGGSSSVYRGQLKDGRIVAIKKLKAHGGPEAESSFLTEIELISRLNHCHVVPLLGYCSESQGKQSERLLVFEYMSKGNLRDCLNAIQEKEPIYWTTRVGIALGVARGLEYLHEAAAPRILHRDIKSSNILLDESYRAKITDLGMAKCLLTDDPASSSSSPARLLGTFGYFAPEYAIVGKASLKSDVFSFGVVILELITGRQPIQKSPDKCDESLVMWATPHLHKSKSVISELPDPLLKGDFPEEEMQIMAHLARECLQWDPESRPTMSEVVQILSTIAPDRSKRRNIPASFFMVNNSSHIIDEFDRPEVLVERPDTNRARVTSERTNEQELVERPDTNRARVTSERTDEQVLVERPDTNRARVTSERTDERRSLPLAIDRNLCEYHPRNSDTVLSAEYMQRLVLLTLNSQGLRQSTDDEALDLTEPRFESFMQASVRSE